MEVLKSPASLSPSWVRKLLLLLPKVALFAIFLLILCWLLLTFVFRPKLLSPLATFSPDLSQKLTAKIAPPSTLALAQSKELPTLVTVPHYLVFNLANGHVYAAKGVSDKISPASFTKLLTGQVALDLGFPEQILTATKTSVDKVPTILGLRVGEQITLSDLLRAAIATSANDAAVTLAEGVASQNGLSLPEFVALMNKKADLLQMRASHFANPDGLDDTNQFTTLSDLAILIGNTVNNYPAIMTAAASDRKDIEQSALHGRYYLPNWNGLLGIYPGVFGLKIAYTENAGYSTIVLANRNNVKLAAIVSGANSYLERDLAAAALLDEGFIAEKIAPANVTKTALNRHYKEWGDLARQIRAEITALGGKPL